MLHPCEHGLMSSADLAHILTLSSNSFRLVCFTVIFPKEKQQVKHLLFCLFSSFKERVLLPFEVTVWVVFQPLMIGIAILCSFWECKGSKKLLLSKFKVKKLCFFLLLFEFKCFRLKRVAKVRRLFWALQEIREINFEACVLG